MTFIRRFKRHIFVSAVLLILTVCFVSYQNFDQVGERATFELHDDLLDSPLTTQKKYPIRFKPKYLLRNTCAAGLRDRDYAIRECLVANYGGDSFSRAADESIENIETALRIRTPLLNMQLADREGHSHMAVGDQFRLTADYEFANQEGRIQFSRALTQKSQVSMSHDTKDSKSTVNFNLSW